MEDKNSEFSGPCSVQRRPAVSGITVLIPKTHFVGGREDDGGGRLSGSSCTDRLAEFVRKFHCKISL